MTLSAIDFLCPSPLVRWGEGGGFWYQCGSRASSRQFVSTILLESVGGILPYLHGYIIELVGWFVGCNGFNGPLRRYFSLYWAVSQREGERRDNIEESKNVQTTPPAPTASAIGPCPTIILIVGRPGTGSLPRAIVPSDHPNVIETSLRVD